MIPLEIIAWSVIAATVAWGLTLRHASAAIRRLRAEASAEIRHAQAEAMRARARAAQLSRELASWTEGCRQGREDVLTLMPMLLAQSDPARIASLATEKDSPS
jgi:hypothetical protein